MPDLIIDPDVQVAVTPLYRVQIAGYSLVLTDQQAFDLYLQLNGLFGENPVLTEQVEELAATVETLEQAAEKNYGNLWQEMDGRYGAISEHMAAIDAALATDTAEPPLTKPPPREEVAPPAPAAPATAEPHTIPPGVTTADAVAAHQSERLVTLVEKREIETAGNPYRVLGQGLTGCGLAKLKEMCQSGYSVREMAEATGIPKGSVDFYLSQHDLRADRRFVVAEERAEESSDEEPVPASEREPMPLSEPAPFPPESAPTKWEAFTPNRKGSGGASRRMVDDALAHLTANGTP